MNVPGDFLERLNAGLRLVAEIPASRKDCRAWVSVYKRRPAAGPIGLEIDPSEGYRVIWVEVKSEDVRRHWEKGHELDLRDSEEYVELLVSEAELGQTLARWIEDTEDYALFVPVRPSTSEYPYFI